jgi:hypothetical protein
MATSLSRQETGVQQMVNEVHQPIGGETKYEEAEGFFIN